MMNASFICLTATALHHCLLAWQTGAYVQLPEFGNAMTQGKDLLFNCEFKVSKQLKPGKYSYICSSES
jgi:hypothetical protein